MKKLILSSVLALGLLSSANAYEVNGDLGVKFTGYKTVSKVAVPGEFKEVKLDISQSDSLSSFLKSAKVEINALSLDTKLPLRNNNITSTLFSLASSQTIKGSISSVDEVAKTLTLDVTLNGVTKQIPMTFTSEGSKIVAKGNLEILDFALQSSFDAFATKVKAFHAGKTFSTVDVEFTLPYK